MFIKCIKRFYKRWTDEHLSNREFDSKPFYNKKSLKSKMKSHDDEARDFHYKEMPKVGSNHTCLAVITVDSVF